MSGIQLFYLLLSLTSLLEKCYSSSEDNMKTYIVYTGNNINDETSSLFLFQNMLQQVAESSSIPRPILHHYKRSFGGFVVKLTEEEADRMAGLDEVVSVFLDEKRQLLTTRSWNFIGFPQQPEIEYSKSDVIIGVIDSGIWPESESFNDKGFTPPPNKWKGTCQASDFNCNNKIIGARYYKNNFGEDFMNNDILSPRDTTGHGTHTASTAAGNPISMTSMLGLGQGTARGGASSSRIAVYKACWSDGCKEVDILAAFDDAIADGVDIISVSLGGKSNQNIYFQDGLSIGAFHAMKNGILTVFAAGNSGPQRSSLTNFSPWAIVVAASTLDRKFVTKIKLGYNRTFEGASLNTFDLKGELFPIIYGGDAPNTEAGFNKDLSRNCLIGSLDNKLVEGKIVLCEGSEGAAEALRAGAVGVLTQGHKFMDATYSFPLPGCYLQSTDAANIHKYIHSTSTPTATIYKTTEFKDNLAPMVASFSSRGPNNATPEILKPDLIAPGVNIIASWSPICPISDTFGENRKLEFNIVSGTSMSCPHVVGAAAYIKSFNLTWSPATIHSALMTTAKQISPDNHAEFAYGAGQIDPIKALNPGLVYDANEVDYITFLCGQGFNTSTLQLITGEKIICSEIAYTTARDLNYPSFALKVPHPKHHISGSFKRTVTNVGSPNSTYIAILTLSKGLNISVNPDVLYFTSLGEKQTYVLTIDGKIKKSIESTSLIWDDGKYQVRSPIVVFDERIEKGRGVSFYCTNYIYIVIFNLLVYIILT
ncbi:hypothetical protein P8452_44211 [Trifolium repens]|nr:hypothetical protein P8452_44211 [Trifolium repens]